MYTRFLDRYKNEMSSKYNKPIQLKIDKKSVISYDDSDPRFHQNIKDSHEYIKNIYPLHFKKRCHNSSEYEKLVKYDFPLINRCWGERYEDCTVLKKYKDGCGNMTANGDKPIIETGYCSCAECAMSLYGPIEDEIGYAMVDLTSNGNRYNKNNTVLNSSDLKKQNEFTIYDKTRVMETDGILIDKSPDVKRTGSNMSVNKAGNGIEYNIELDDRYADFNLIENFGKDMISSVDRSIGLEKGLILLTIICIILLCYMP
jgi:hypothetical protein